MSWFSDLSKHGGDIVSTLTEEGFVYYASDADQNDTVTGQTSFAATTPTLMLDIPSGTTCIPLGVTLQQAGTVAGGAITVIIEVDDIDRYGSGGTAETKLNARIKKGTTNSNVAVYSGATANAGYGVRLDGWVVGADVDTAEGVDNGIIWTPNGPTILEGPAAFLVFTYAASTGPTWLWTMKWAEFSTDRLTQ